MAIVAGGRPVGSIHFSWLVGCSRQWRHTRAARQYFKSPVIATSPEESIYVLCTTVL